MTIVIEVVSKMGENTIYIGRPSPLGNPFPMTKESQRQGVCGQYEIWFQQQVVDEVPEVMQELENILNKAIEYGLVRLKCFCAPRACHGDTIKAYLIKQLRLRGYDVM